VCRTLVAFASTLLLTGSRLGVGKPVQGFQTQAVLCQTVGQRFLMKVYGNKMEKQFLDEDNKSGGK
jgi:hypothetical protein